MSNYRCMGHLYNQHMKIREREKFRCCSKSPLTSLLGQEKIESKPFFFCWKLDSVLFQTQLDSPSNSSGVLRYRRNNLTLHQNLSQTASPKVLHHLHLGPWALYDLGLVLGWLGTFSHLLGRHPLLLYK